MATIGVPEDVLDFLTGIHGDRSNCSLRKKAIFSRAFKSAYKDMSVHTVEYKSEAKYLYFGDDSKRCLENKHKVACAIKEYVEINIFKDFLSDPQKYCSQEKFDCWHRKACYSFAKIDCEVLGLRNSNNEVNSYNISELLFHRGDTGETIFTHGQAQKLVNMMVKYFYIFYQCEGWKELENIKFYAHAPIDSFVLKAAFFDEDYCGPAWSRITDYDFYIGIKNRIDNVAKAQKYSSGFLWELANWPFSR